VYLVILKTYSEITPRSLLACCSVQCDFSTAHKLYLTTRYYQSSERTTITIFPEVLSVSLAELVEIEVVRRGALELLTLNLQALWNFTHSIDFHYFFSRISQNLSPA